MKRFVILLILVSVTCVWGCATNRDLRVVNQRLSSRIHTLDTELSALKADIEKLRKNLDRLESSSKTLGKTQADTGADFIDLRTSVQSLRGDVEKVGKEMADLRSGMEGDDTTSIRQKFEDISFRVKYIESYLGLGKKPEVEKKKPEEKDTKKTSLKKAIDKEKAYAEAYKLFKEGKYGAAREKFREFVKTFPDTEYSDNAQFWIGECYYFEKSYEKAILEYEQVIKDYPKGNKVPNSLLKQSLAFLNLGDKSSAKLLLQRVIKEYPNTSPARIARGKLASIKQ